ncbi:ABC transporter permease [Blastococcus brunescens]|uniref:ABC transporter permease subunit n=1 Tax=Blastococcus brunescens TaxID=1564165 RepID=A0ABZ1AYE3_9ACTN|nr:ABC transporter permease subunit [Blastococcus sp. BMG 8361]WRL63582.1 ABC transporter permease subunit [Blastococcus sp. BMG 8361]
MQGWAIGLGISILLAAPLGVLIGSNAYLDRATRATVEFLRPVPSVALLPLAILVLGISMDMKIFLVAFATFWPILVQAIYGVQDVDPVARDTARSFGVGRVAIFFRVTLPSAAPTWQPASVSPPRSASSWRSPPSSSPACPAWGRRSCSRRAAVPTTSCTPSSWPPG